MTKLIEILNSVFEREGQSISLKPKDFEAGVIRKLPKADICRWKGTDTALLSRVANEGILNKDIVDRDDLAVRNTNGQTHFAFNSTIETMFSAIPFDQVFKPYSLCYPCTMLEGNLHVLLSYLPEEYYSRERKNYLLSEYNHPENRRQIEIALKIEAQDRVMVANKTSITNSDIPLGEKLFFLESRFLLFKDDYMVILKLKSQMKYMMFFIPRPSLNEEELELIGDIKAIYTINQQLYKINHLQINSGSNILIFGAPGTGKSHYIKEKYEHSSESIRIVFHEEYSYQDFVGCIKPIITNDVPTYSFIPGPFTKILKLAIENKMISYTLIIEELNRANAASVFGDVFQLLDRDENCISEYSIGNEDILNYLNEDTVNSYSEIRLPGNLSIVATMNSADQGVFPLDTAFKRRWNYEYMPIEFEEWHDYQTIPYISVEKVVRYISIKDYLETINTYLSAHEILEINEDRLIGPYYLKQNEWEAWQVDQSYKKLLAYLWDDVARLDRGTVFKEELIQFSHVCAAAEKKQQVFTDTLHVLLKGKLLPYETSTEDGM
ncbi:AAA family ATPase [Sporosarcina psychrophila]|uniref:AAA family ATPase n=1 Tax=Sporosarcina psychrophila TaxID=1476 RepID=UPI0030D13310